MNRNGSMTVPKLVTIILAIVILIFLVFGATQLRPLVAKLGVMFDNVLYFFNLKDDGSLGGCTSVRILDWGVEGLTFLDGIGVPEGERENTFFGICDDGTCMVFFQSEEGYRIKNGEFDFVVGDEAFSRDEYLFLRNAKDTKDDWEIYHGVLDLMEDELGPGEFKRIYDGLVTKTFTLYGDGNFRGKEIYAVWEDKQWTIGDKNFAPHIDEGAIDWFVGEVTGELDDNALISFFKGIVLNVNDNIYFREAKPLTEDISKENPKKDWQTIDVLVGGDNNKLDKSSEVETFKEKFSEIKERLLEESELSAENFEDLSRAVDRKTISAGGFIYTLSLEMGNKDRPEIVLTNGTREYRLRFSDDVETERNMGDESPIGLERYQVELTHNIQNLVKPMEIDYKLPKDKFDEFYKLNLIKDFIRSKCR